MTHVDHCGDKEFRHLVADFEAQTNEPDSAKYHDSGLTFKFYAKIVTR